MVACWAHMWQTSIPEDAQSEHVCGQCGKITVKKMVKDPEKWSNNGYYQAKMARQLIQ